MTIKMFVCVVCVLCVYVCVRVSVIVFFERIENDDPYPPTVGTRGTK